MMHTAALSLLDTLIRHLASNHYLYLLTLVNTFGSSPRPLGSLALITPAGNIYGSVSSGCIETELVEQLLSGRCEFPFIQRFGLSEEDNVRLGLPCGGQVDILVERLSAKDMASYSALHSGLRAGQNWIKRLELQGGRCSFARGKLESGFCFDAKVLQQEFGPQFSLLLVGAGALAKSIADFALALEYRVVICDPRQQRLDDLAIEPESSVQLVQAMPDDYIRDYMQANSLANSALITLSHDPKIDDMALMEALLQPFFFVGALGSQRTTLQRKSRLLELGVSAEQLQALQAPVGLDIGSKAPAEIAISILAQLTQLRRRAGVAYVG